MLTICVCVSEREIGENAVSSGGSWLKIVYAVVACSLACRYIHSNSYQGHIIKFVTSLDIVNKLLASAFFNHRVEADGLIVF